MVLFLIHQELQDMLKRENKQTKKPQQQQQQQKKKKKEKNSFLWKKLNIQFFARDSRGIKMGCTVWSPLHSWYALQNFYPQSCLTTSEEILLQVAESCKYQNPGLYTSWENYLYMKSHGCQWQGRGSFMLFPGGGLCCQTSVLSVFQTSAWDTLVNTSKNV